MDTETDTAVVEQHGVSQEQHQTGHLTMSYQRLEYLEYIFKTYFLAKLPSVEKRRVFKEVPFASTQ